MTTLGLQPKILTVYISYHVPKHIQEHIDYITPGLKLMPGSSVTKRGFGMSGRKGAYEPPKSRPHDQDIPTDLAHCDVAITPACIAELYEIPPGKLADPSNAMGIFEEGDFYSQEDLNLFFTNYMPQIPNGTHPTPAFIDGAQAPVPLSSAGGESELDFELAYPIIYPQGTVLYQTDDLNYATGVISTAGAFNTFLDAIDGVRFSTRLLNHVTNI
jgi:tripeptidyl-peptidase I